MLSRYTLRTKGLIPNHNHFRSINSIPTRIASPVNIYRFAEDDGKTIDRLLEECRTEESYQKLLATKGSEPYHATILARLGDIHFSGKRFDEAYNNYAKSIKKDPKKVSSYLKLADIIELEGDIDYAIEVLESGLAHMPENRQLQAKLQSLYGEQEYVFYSHRRKVNSKQQQNNEVQQNNNKQYIQVPTQSKSASSIKEFLDRIAGNPQNVQTVLQMIELLIAQEKVLLGKNIFQDLTQSYKTFALYFGAGSFFFQVGQVDQARNYLKKANQINQSHFQVNLFLGILAQKEDNINQAITYLEKAVSIEPRQSDGFTNLGLIYLQRKEGMKAKQFFQNALIVNPNDTIALSSMGTINIAQGLLEEGLNHLRRALELDPSNDTTRSNLASTLFIIGEHEQAELILNAPFPQSKK